MAFGISCSLSTKRKQQISNLPPDFGRDEAPPPGNLIPLLERKTRYGVERRLPTLVTCGLSDSLFFGEPKWPRIKKAPAGDAAPVLPAVSLCRATRHGLTYPEADIFTKMRKKDLAIKEKLQKMKFPVLDILQPSRWKPTDMVKKEGRGRPHPNTSLRHVALPRSIRSNMVWWKKKKIIFLNQQKGCRCWWTSHFH
eukprot:TRINITY_DN5467_c0_g1_i2.p1 TRINITY_DN5467_c0_g1~~TRINITY_DN5467_c0_g1_i2.p1  ORF type:complete len:196 (+),score=18.01 TRINITY_DN5467_c0_g1_i2:82-669(+)